MMSRVYNAKRNVFIGVFCKIALMVLAFILRTTFIRLLGAEYTGVSSLFTNILSVLSLAELGIGNISTFYLYKYLVIDDKSSIEGLITYFKKMYRWIMVTIFALGVLLIPFLHFFIKTTVEKRELFFIYILYLISSVCSYLFEYRVQIIRADQKEYYINISAFVSTILTYVFQILVLVAFRNFSLYLIIQIILTFGNRCYLNGVVNKHYPFLRNKSNEAPINVFDYKKVKYDIVASFFGKLAGVLLNQTDSIIISVMFSTYIVGLYSNYYLIIAYLLNFIGVVYSSVIASYGNLLAENRENNNIKIIFDATNLAFWLISTICILFYSCLIQDFIPIWIGKQYLMGKDIIIAICFSFLVSTIYNPILIFRNTLGIFRKGLKERLFAVLWNVILSIILGYYFGVSGIIIATPIAKILSFFPKDVQLVYSEMQWNIVDYIKKTLIYFVQFLLILMSTYIITYKMHIEGAFSMMVKVFVGGMLFVLISYLMNRNTKEYQYIKIKMLSRTKDNKLI